MNETRKETARKDDKQRVTEAGPSCRRFITSSGFRFLRVFLSSILAGGSGRKERSERRTGPFPLSSFVPPRNPYRSALVSLRSPVRLTVRVPRDRPSGEER